MNFSSSRRSNRSVPWVGRASEGQLRSASQHAFILLYVGLSLACLGQKEEAIREGVEGLEGRREAKDAFNVRFHLYLLARTLVLVDGPEKAIDQLQALTRTPFFVSPARVGIDPNFAPLRKNPRFQKLVARGK